jgi:serine protease Do
MTEGRTCSIIISIFISFLILASSLFANPESASKLCPLPMIETENVLTNWFIGSGFDVSRTSLEDGQIRLKGTKGEESWEVILKPHSPLTSLVLAHYTFNGQADSIRVERLWAYLERYAKDQHSEVGKEAGQEVPLKALSQSQSVVCIRARLENGEIQFSGFFIDPKGLILSTAHDLKSVQGITIIFQNSQELPGNVIKIDPHRDLTLMDVKSKSNAFISLAMGRNILKNGEKVYSEGCSADLQRTVHSGFIDGPLRRVDGLPLWQVDMETLPGTSGSPVFDTQGNLVAVVKGRFRGTDSVGFLIPLETLVEFLKEK